MDDIDQSAHALVESLRTLPDVELRQTYLYFTISNNGATEYNFRQAVQADNYPQLLRVTILLFNFILLANGQAARTLVEREIVRRFINLP